MTLRVNVLSEAKAWETINRCNKCGEMKLVEHSEISLTPASAPLRHTPHVAKGVRYDCAECNDTSVAVSYLSIRGDGAAEALKNWRAMQAGSRSFYNVGQRFIDAATGFCVIEEWNGTPFVIHRAHFGKWHVSRSAWASTATQALAENDEFIRATWDVQLRACVEAPRAELQAGADRLRQMLGRGENIRPSLPASPAPRLLERDTSALRRLLKS